MAPANLGPFCTASGITVDTLVSGNQFPALSRDKISNGLVIELLRFSGVRRIDDSTVADWLTSLGLLASKDELLGSIASLREMRNDLRRKRKVADIHILEYKVFQVLPLSGSPAPNNQPPQRDHVPATSTPKHSHVPINPIARETNELIHEQMKEQRALQKIKNTIEEAKGELKKALNTSGHFKPANVRKRDQRAQKTREANIKLTEDVAKLQKEICVLQERIQRLSEENFSLKRSKRYFKNKLLCQKENPPAIAEEEFTEISQSPDADTVLTKNKNKFKDTIRACVLELLGLEVATAKISPVIEVVGRLVFNHEFKEGELPSRSTCQEISDQGQYIAKKYFGKRINESSGIGIHKDGTSRKRRKIIDATIVTDQGEAFCLGFNVVASETGQIISDNVVSALSETVEPDKIKSTANKIRYTMSDRAANEKKSNQLLSKWRTDMLGTECEDFENFHCMAHVLLGFQTDCLKHLKSVQQKLNPDGKMGRDKVKGFKLYKKDEATSRMCAAVSSAFGPLGEHFGVRDKWEAYCHKEGIVSTVTNYKDNRFNGLFAVAASTVLHRQDFRNVLALVAEPNKKLAALKEDLADDDLITLMQGLAIMFVRVTKPFFDMVTPSKTTYLQLGPVIKNLLDDFKNASKKPNFILSKNSFPSLQKFQNSTPFDAIIPTKISPSLWLTLSELSKAFIATITRQLQDFLKKDLDIHKLDKTKFAPATNLVCERNFGDLDSSQNRRPSASFFHHSTVHALKRHRKGIATWLSSMSSGERRKLWSDAGRHAPSSRKEHQAACRNELLKSLSSSSVSRAVSKKIVEKAKKSQKTSVIDLRLQKLKSATVSVDQWVTVAYADNWYPGIVTSLINDNTFEVDFCTRMGRKNDFKWPEGKDRQIVERKFLLSVDTDVFTATGRTWNIRGAKENDLLFKAFSSRFF